MPTGTYDLISEQVLGSAAASVTFSSIPGTYKDLVLECVGTLSSDDGYIPILQFNSDAGTNYSFTIVQGNGSASQSNRGSNVTYIGNTNNPGWSIDSTKPSISLYQIQSYANTNVNKTVLSRLSSGSTAYPGVTAAVGLWRSNSAITSVYIFRNGTGSFASGCTFRLWGVAG